MRQVDKNNAIKPVSDPVRADECQYEAAAVASGRKGEGLYFPVNLDDEATVAGTDPAAGGDAPERDGLYFPVNSKDAPERPATEPTGGDAPERDACTSLLISGTTRSGLQPKRPRHDGPDRSGLYFPVNSRNDSPGAARMRPLADRCRFRRMLRRPRPDRHCQSCRSLLTRTPRRSAHLPALPLFCCAK
jgi:hypothetical protein